MCVHLCGDLHVCVSLCMYACVLSAHMCLCTCVVHACVFGHMCVYVCMHVCMCICVCMSLCVCFSIREDIRLQMSSSCCLRNLQLQISVTFLQNTLMVYAKLHL